MSDSPASKFPQLDVPSAASKPRPQKSQSQLFTSKPLFQTLGTQNASRSDLNSPHPESPDPQRLPRPQAAPSLAGPSVRPSVVLQQPVADQRKLSQNNLGTFPESSENQDVFHPEAIWAEMQRTLADVELSALNTSSSSHIFGTAHARVLEDLRSSQLALAQAWARSEADEVGGHDSDDSFGSGSEFATIRKVDGLTSSPSQTRDRLADDGNATSPRSRRRASSAASTSTVAEDLEAETERDIQLARKRRAANDRYFEQVNKGVLDVVAKLDEVASAMKQVERESREIWDDGDISSEEVDDDHPGPAHNGSKNHAPDHDDKYDLEHILTRTTTTGTGVASTTDTDHLSDSPTSPKRPSSKRKEK